MVAPTKTRILDAALKLFLRQGVAATRTQDICWEAGVSNGSLFHAFANKEAIAVALYVGAIASYQSALLAELDAGRPARDTIRALVMAHWAWIRREEPQARFLFVQGAPTWHDDAARQTFELNARLRSAVSAWLAAPPQRAAIRDVPEDAFLPLLIGPSMMVIRAWLRMPGSSPPLERAECFTDAALRSLLRRYDDE